jgi:hypothetical protein
MAGGCKTRSLLGLDIGGLRVRRKERVTAKVEMGFPARPRPSPGRSEIGWRKRVPRGPSWSFHNGPGRVGNLIFRAQMLAEIIIDHLGAGLCPMTDGERCLRPHRAGLGLPVAEGSGIGQRGLGRRHRVAGNHDGTRAGLRPAAWQQEHDDREPKHHSKEKSHSPPSSPAAVRPPGLRA